MNRRLQRLRFQYGRRLPLYCGLVFSVIFILGYWMLWSGDTKVKVIFVEEHHEVLGYWFDAVRDGTLPASGVTLVHIDAHSDAASPSYKPGYPLFRFPKNKKELRLMMQRNDVFIQEAIMTNLIDKFIWIWPSWDIDNKEEHEQTYVIDEIEIGWFMMNKRESKTGIPRKDFCLCQKEGNKRECFYMNLEGQASPRDDDHEAGVEDNSRDRPSAENFAVPLDESRCHVQKTTTTVEAMDHKALELLRAGKLVYPNETVLLDIDEDYYGVESGADTLMQAKVPIEWILKVDEILTYFICPQKTVDEHFADIFLVGIIKSILDGCAIFKGKMTPCRKVNPQFTHHIFSTAKKQSQTYFWKSPDMFCSDSEPRRYKQLFKLVESFLYLNYQQLSELKKVGFCMTTTIKSLGFSQGLSVYKICHGVNLPGDALVTLHLPSEPEIERRTRELTEMLRSKTYIQPKLITVCRSMRDGYTPKKSWRVIEQGVLGAIQSSKSKDTYKVVYDKDLMGGARGWPHRHESIPSVNKN